MFDPMSQEEEMWDQGEEAYEAYITEIIKCPCGVEASRLEMAENHWCDKLEGELNALHSTKG